MLQAREHNSLVPSQSFLGGWLDSWRPVKAETKGGRHKHTPRYTHTRMHSNLNTHRHSKKGGPKYSCCSSQ